MTTKAALAAILSWRGLLFLLPALLQVLFVRASPAGYAEVYRREEFMALRRRMHDDHNWPDDLGPAPDGADGYWNQTYSINGQTVTAGTLDNILRGDRPIYDKEVICAPTDICCPAYCCSVVSTVHELGKPFDHSRMKAQTAYVNGSFEVLSKTELAASGRFSALLYHDFQSPISGGWTVVLYFSKTIVDLHSFNAKILGAEDAGKVYYLGPMNWNQNIPRGMRRIMVQGQTAPVNQDHIPLDIKGALFYDPTQQPQGPVVLPPVPQEPRPVAVPPARGGGDRYNLAEALQLAILFYEVQRSGRLPRNKRIPWRGDSFVTDETETGKDLSGGWYDAGDGIKFVLTMAYSAGVMLWGLLRYPESFEAAGEMDNMLDGVKWALDFFIKAHTSSKEFYVQVSDQVDHCYWQAPEQPVPYRRKPYKVTCTNPGSQPVMLSAAALAAGSMVFRKRDGVYADKLLHHAQELFAFGEQCPGDYFIDGHIPVGGMYPGDGKFKDEEAWAATWLFKATGQGDYLDKAKAAYWDDVSDPWRVLHWSDVSVGVNLLLYEVLGWSDFAEAITTHMDRWLHDVPRTPKGLAYLMEWGTNRFAAAAAFQALVAADLGLNAQPYRVFAVQQIFYMLGDCCIDPATGKSTMSHLVGFGPAWPRSVHHRGSTCDSKGHCSCTINANVHTVWGGLIGGPDKQDQFSAEGCSDFIRNEVAIDYNAAFLSAVAGLEALSLAGTLQQYISNG